MKLRKIAAAIVTAAIALSAAAFGAAAESTTIELDSEYAGNWGAGEYIPKEDLLAIGGDVKITLEIETIEPEGEKQFLVTPMDYKTPAWSRITNKCTSDTIVAKEDQFIVLVQGEKSVEFVVPRDVIEGLTEVDGEGGIGFQVCSVIVKSATLEPGTPEAEYRIIDEDNVIPYCFGEYQMPEAEEAAEAPAEAETASADTSAESTESDFPATGNAPIAAVVSVVITAGAVMALTRKRK
ncbi:MAG: hypothetical protein ACI4J5_07275 [Oscillospiraceae bacterium]